MRTKKLELTEAQIGKIEGGLLKSGGQTVQEMAASCFEVHVKDMDFSQGQGDPTTPKEIAARKRARDRMFETMIDALCEAVTEYLEAKYLHKRKSWHPLGHYGELILENQHYRKK